MQNKSTQIIFNIIILYFLGNKKLNSRNTSSKAQPGISDKPSEKAAIFTSFRVILA